MIIPMENIRASQTPEALARDEKRRQEFMNRVCQAALKKMTPNFFKEVRVYRQDEKFIRKTQKER